MNDLVSIIMAEYNSNFDELRESIDSILNQSYTNFELIIIDDKTNEENRTYLYKLQSQHDNIKVIINERNLGLASSLNKAIKSSQGKYIFRMDTDDISFTNRIEHQVELLKKGHPIVTSRAILINENGNEVGRTKCLPFHNIIKRFQLYYLFLNGVIHPLVAAKREVFIEFEYDVNVKYAQDFELWMRMSDKYKMYFDKDILLKYRVSNTNENKLLYQYNQHNKVAKRYIGNNFIKKIGFYISDIKYKKIIDSMK